MHEGVGYQTTTEFFGKSAVHSGWDSFVLGLDNFILLISFISFCVKKIDFTGVCASAGGGNSKPIINVRTGRDAFCVLVLRWDVG